MIDDRTATGFAREMSFKEYKKHNLNMMKRDFCLRLTKEDLDHYNKLDTKEKVDQFRVAILNREWR